MILQNMNRYQAFALHMAISLVIFTVLLICITQYWYPGILFDTGNGWKAIAMIVGIDLILGPLLTLIVFNPLKSSLKFDLTIIALVQSAALIYGTWTIQQTRPIALAFINTSFMTIYANNEIADDIQKRVSTLNSNQLYYLFDDSAAEESLNANRFESYQDFSLDVAKLNSVYKSDDLIALDPLSSANRFIKINLSTGDIVNFVQK